MVTVRPMSRTALARLVIVACAALLATLLAPAPATYAANDYIQLSTDGQTWGSTLPGPLFGSTMRWVPGDQVTRSFWVRNNGPSAARTFFGLTSDDVDQLIANDDMTVSARVQGGSWTRLTNGGTLRTLGSDPLARGAKRRVDVSVAFLFSSPNRSQTLTLPFRITVRMSQSVAGIDVGNGGNGNGNGGKPGQVDGTQSDNHGNGFLGGLLPNTGSWARPWMLWLAGILIGTGLALLVARRRDKEEREVPRG